MNASTKTRERPILFSGPMVRAILDGRKTQTRRVVKPQPEGDFAHFVGKYHPLKTDKKTGMAFPGDETFGAWGDDQDFPCPYGAPSDRLWVRETFGLFQNDRRFPLQYAADYDDLEEAGVQKWKPSIFMPRRASRLTLEILSVRVERLDGISEDDAKAEGVPPALRHPAVDRLEAEGFEWCPYTTEFRGVWEDINGEGAWDVNPWVWVIEFKRVEVSA